MRGFKGGDRAMLRDVARVLRAHAETLKRTP